MIENLVYIVSLVIVILFFDKSNILLSLKKNIKNLLSFKNIFFDKSLDDLKKSKRIKIISKKLLKESLYQCLIFIIIFTFYLILIFFNPFIETILFSYIGVFEAIAIYLIYIKIKKNE